MPGVLPSSCPGVGALIPYAKIALPLRRAWMQVGRDPRPVMRAVYETFKNGESPDKIQVLRQTTESVLNLQDEGLWHLQGTLDDPGAKRDILRACATPYAQLSDDYMAALARVHLRQRGWLEAE
eukprot:1142510-Pelagomonas_calceolata.AAC.1